MQRRKVVTAAAGLLGAAAAGPMAASPAGAAPAAPALRLGQIRLVTLSHVNDPAQTFIFPGDPSFTLSTAATIEQDGYYLQYVQEGEHTGSHWGAPGHFNPDAVLADQMDPNDLLLPVVRIDIRAQAARDADYALTVADLQQWERRHGPIPAESAIVLWTGYGAKWGTPAYPNLDQEGRIHQPGFGLDAVRWLIAHGKLGYRGALGTDTLGPDVGIDDTFGSSTLLYENRRISLENMANLELLPTTGAWVLPGGPINRRGSGSPAHIFGLIPAPH
ncbi:MAG TPA: cyclase family protein [Rugosimonospora sp.]|nr:cyclase family protein [Rugosimonospora sp.]